ncbi:hypothetical protein RRG08_017277 [Elysia crispata]|uniref:Uncharacterized protein n=1 Tax=Elysia crispata TaxID=231223 RepID=A0AAE0XQP5_9GAST|nr:hypothetical protein RRG08_017277 [Elysia crispata]
METLSFVQRDLADTPDFRFTAKLSASMTMDGSQQSMLYLDGFDCCQQDRYIDQSYYRIQPRAIWMNVLQRNLEIHCGKWVVIIRYHQQQLRLWRDSWVSLGVARCRPHCGTLRCTKVLTQTMAEPGQRR